MGKKTLIQQGKRKRAPSDLTCCGRVSLFLGETLRRRFDLIARKERRTYAEIGRIAVTRLVEEYNASGVLPEVPEARKRAGRKRAFYRFPGEEE